MAGCGGLCVVPAFGLGSPLHVVTVSLALSCPSCIASPLPFSTVCVCCHSIVDLVVCHCDSAVSLWNSGG